MKTRSSRAADIGRGNWLRPQNIAIGPPIARHNSLDWPYPVTVKIPVFTFRIPDPNQHQNLISCC